MRRASAAYERTPRRHAWRAVALFAPFLALPAEAIELPTANPALFSELSPERTLPSLIKALRDALVDANSVTNLSVCYPPVRVKMTDGRPARWTVMFALNSKNSLGGYTGLQQMAPVFHADGSTRIIQTGFPPSASALATCARVPDAEVRRILDAR